MLLAVTGGILGAWWFVPASPVAVPGRDIDSLIWPLMPAVLALVVPTAALAGQRDLERTSGRSIIRMRIGFCVGVSALVVLVSVGALRFDALVVMRNGLLLLGLGLLGATTLGPGGGWFLPFSVPTGMWIFGTTHLGPNTWATVLHERDSQIALVSALAVWLGGCILYCLKGWWPQRG